MENIVRTSCYPELHSSQYSIYFPAVHIYFPAVHTEKFEENVYLEY